MLTHRLWYRAIRTRENVYKTEVVRTIRAPFPLGVRRSGKTPQSLVEVRCILFSTQDQCPRAFSIAEANTTTIMNDTLRDYDYALAIAVSHGYTPPYPPTPLMPKHEYCREVPFTFLRNWFSVIAWLQTNWYGQWPPLVPDKVCMILYWDADTLELLRVCIMFEIIEPTPRLLPLRCTELDEILAILQTRLNIRYGVPDPPIPVYDTYVTFDFDCYDYEDLQEARECMKHMNHVVSVIRYAKHRGDVIDYILYETERGYHLIVHFAKPVDIYRLRRILGDDEDRLKMDILRYVVSGVHDTLFTHKGRIGARKARRNEWLSRDRVWWDT